MSFIQQALEARAETPPLQRYSLDKLTLLGLDCVEGRALLQDPEGAQHTVAIGEYIGRNWG